LKDLNAIYYGALELPEEDRPAYLTRACGGDPELLARVVQMLSVADEAEAFFTHTHSEATLQDREPGRGSAPSVKPDPYDGPDEVVGQMIGRYKIMERLGEGGCGVVYVAEQTEPVRRRVALKIIKLGMDTKAVVARFEAERQALAMMDHPNIAKVLDGGSTDHGRPFFVMELVRGIGITDYCDQAQLPPRERLDLFVMVCQAIQHAHQKGIIHRDIKPSNILVTLNDGVPVPKVIDFGIAKATEGRLTDATVYTQLHQFIGTPAYMSPEQAEMSSLDIDTRSDIYSLGVLLYELLAGSPPFDGKELMSQGLDAMRRMIREKEPARPSQRLSTLRGDSLSTTAKRRAIEAPKLLHLLKGDLDWIVMKCLEKNRAHRYETANGLAADLKRYLANEAVEARPPSATYRLKKFVRRHPLQLALAGTVALLLLVVATVAWWQHVQAVAQREANLQQQIETERRLAADNARLARNSEAVTALLNQCEEALKAGDKSRANVALEAARKRSAEGGAENQTERFGRLVKDLELLGGLDAVDQFRWTYVDNHYPDPTVTATRTREALDHFGIDPDAVSLDDAAARVSNSVVRERIVPALDRLLQHQKNAAVRDLLGRVDSDPYRDAVRDAVLAEDEGRIKELAAQEDALAQPPGFAVFLGVTKVIDVERRQELLRAALSRRTSDVDLLMTLAATSPYPTNHPKRLADRTRWLQAALATAPDNVSALNDLGSTLVEDSPQEATRYLKRAIESDPGLAHSHNNMGNILQAEGRLEEAAESFQKAIEVDPKYVGGYVNQAYTLLGSGRLEEGLEWARKAVALAPNSAMAHSCLGAALQGMGRLDEAVACQRKALELDPNLSNALAALGSALRLMGRLDEAIAYQRKTIEVDPTFPNAQADLDKTVRTMDQLDEDLVKFRKFLEERHPHDPEPYLKLGMLLCEAKRDYDGAIPYFQKALELDPKSAPAHTWLGAALHGKGRDSEAMAGFQKAIALDPKYTEAHVKLALLSALAAAGNAATPDPGERTRLRKQALDSLRETLTLLDEQLDSGPPDEARRTLRSLQCEIELASLRDAAALAKLPVEERKAFAQVWTDLAVLLKKAEAPQPGTGESIKTEGFGPLGAASPSVVTTLVPGDSVWRWLHPVDGIDPAEADPDFHTTFFAPDYDDTSWNTGKDREGTDGGFGYGDSGFNGVDIETPTAPTAGGSAYFRCRFTTDKSYDNLELRCQMDDGIIVYLDGREVARANMSEGPDAYPLPADQPIGGAMESTVWRIPLAGVSLPAAEHVLAISLHNPEEPSSDLRIGGITLVEVDGEGN
jgi:serine/threonine protein kinase/Flp pilus assembly protein TadD